MLVILDLDGTLIDSQKAHLNSFRKALERADLYPSKDLMEEIKERFGRPGYEILREVLPGKNEYFIRALQKSAHNILLKEELRSVELLPHVKEFLDEYKHEHVLSVATSSSTEFAHKVLEKLGIKDYFKTIITSEDVERQKPNPDLINKTLEEAGFSKEDAVYFGDTVFDAIAGRRAGVKFTGVLLNSLYPEKLKKEAGSVIKHLGEVSL